MRGTEIKIPGWTDKYSKKYREQYKKRVKEYLFSNKRPKLTNNQIEGILDAILQASENRDMFYLDEAIMPKDEFCSVYDWQLDKPYYNHFTA